MRLLAFSDLHRDRRAAERLVQMAQACASCRSAQVLHGEAREIAGAQFFGLGGGVPPTPFPWSFDLTEDEAADKLESCPDGAVLVVHSPPKGHVDEVYGRHLGSESILAAIERSRPVLAVCGHIHQCWGGEAAIGTTPVFNLGPEGRFFDV
jgi:Icc-related predicted phosphoesterase